MQALSGIFAWSMPMGIWVGLPLAGALLLGLVLVVMAWRGRRVDDHPLCRKCGYDHFGLPAESAVCPECGADRHAATATRIGHRRVRRRLLAAGLALLLPGAIGLGTVGYVVVRKVDVNQYKPVWWLLADADRGSPAAQTAAFDELHRRIKLGLLTDAQAEQMVDRVLEIQGDLARTWDERWGGFGNPCERVPPGWGRGPGEV
jgi:hypothetical protein